ncbi:ComF family protein, partial [Pyramidobacter sp.]|uniref:ComF family protein n=1 Tax=Pyramidobacter sp. TaxID=1943581 RepID=UPI002A8456EF|nr:ComF family protein [Pyramidobacter sp.]
WKEKRTPQKRQPDSQSRRAMPEDSFVCAGAAPERVLLLDDVSTTGTTLLRAAQCLYGAGAQQVTSLCWSVASRR